MQKALIKTKLHLQLGALKEEFNLSWEYKPCTRKPVFVFYSTKCEDCWTTMEDSSHESFQGSQLLILHKRCNYGFSLTGKQYKMKEHREKSPIPFFLCTSLSLTYLLHNSMSKELFGKALKCKKKK